MKAQFADVFQLIVSQLRNTVEEITSLIFTFPIFVYCRPSCCAYSRYHKEFRKFHHRCFEGRYVLISRSGRRHYRRIFHLNCIHLFLRLFSLIPVYYHVSEFCNFRAVFWPSEERWALRISCLSRYEWLRQRTRNISEGFRLRSVYRSIYLVEFSNYKYTYMYTVYS